MTSTMQMDHATILLAGLPIVIVLKWMFIKYEDSFDAAPGNLLLQGMDACWLLCQLVVELVTG